ncbi:class II glutamine amidotransferase [Bifidobacterium sp. ESL0790]|uniref:class II glutamine amidotransferase n=1 Tax=Bifidobacterium sp. ESL0790 TaxID=2983233 RepID=UPI0023F93383|nr:class II glutamine amidotransferase [Bifidobacterium sp. ESL0790]WEV72566.1 class II glutamine amidotransferase [Bifidobacterium sp. ESL0790]
MSLRDLLGARDTADFRRLSEIHRDGWGVSMDCGPGVREHDWDVDDVRAYHTTMAAYEDPQFESLADVPALGALWHLRWGSPGVPGVLENQQPFILDGLSFIHNGHIASDDGVNVLDNPDFDVDREILGSISLHSDSAIFFAVIVRFVRDGFKLPEAMRRAVAKLRETYPRSSFNCIVQDAESMVAVRAVGHEKTHDEIIDFYNDYGWTGQAEDYGVIRYRGIDRDADGSVDDSASAGAPAKAGATKGVVVASSGFRQRTDEGWRDLPNNHMLVASRATGEYEIEAL